MVLCSGLWSLLPVWFQGADPGALQLTDNRTSYADGRVPTYCRFEIAFPSPRAYANPFAPFPVNPEDSEADLVDEHGAQADLGGATVEGIFRSPSGAELHVLGFWDESGGASLWRIRMTPTEPGEWTYVVQLRDAVGRTEAGGRFTATESDDRGFVRPAPGTAFFSFDDGSAFIPLGNNLVKTTDPAIIDLWAARLRDHKMNCQRDWLHPHHTAIEWTASGPNGESYVPDAPGLGRYCQRTARSLDHVVEAAEANGLYTILCQDDTICYQNSPHGEPRIGWEYNPYRAICPDGIRFYTDDLGKRYYKRRLRYMVARWGYSPHVFAWELQNEVDWPYLNTVYPDRGSRWKLTDLVAWHDEMAGYLRAIDPYHRPVSANTASNCLGWEQTYNWDPTKYDDRLFLLHANMDFANHHVYDEDPESIAKSAARFREKTPGKPLLFGEWGLSPYFDQGEQAVTVPVGLHNAMWTALTTSGAAPLHWFWDKYYEVGGLDHYRIMAECLYGLDPLANGMLFATPDVSGPAPLKAFAWVGPRHALVWVWDTRSRQGAPEPEPVEGAVLTVSGIKPEAYWTSFIDPWTGHADHAEWWWKEEAERIKLPTFTRDLVVRVDPS